MAIRMGEGVATGTLEPDCKKPRKVCGNFEQVKDYLYSWEVHTRTGSLGVGGGYKTDDNLTRVHLAV